MTDKQQQHLTALGNAVADIIGDGVEQLPPEAQADFVTLHNAGASVVLVVHSAPMRVVGMLEFQGEQAPLFEICSSEDLSN